jgi:hypothetical protein
MSSFMFEAMQGEKWDPQISELRFDKKEDAEEYQRRLTTQWGIAQRIRVVSSTDPPNCTLVGGIGNRELKRF